jgi:hypothetical protein
VDDNFEKNSNDSINYPVKTNSETYKKCFQPVYDAAPTGEGEDGALEVLFLPNHLPDGGPTVPESNQLVVQANVDWSDCMKGKGFSFETSDNAFVYYMHKRETTKDGKATPDEIATAKSDLQCKIDTNLVGKDLAVQTAYDNQYIDSHREKLEAWRQKFLDYIAGK